MRAAIILGLLGGIGWALRRAGIAVVEVRGESMRPTLEPGDLALTVRPGRVRRGDVVVVEHLARPGLELVKRVIALPGERAPDGRVLGPGELWVEGDRPERSTDSRRLGPVSEHDVRARVALVLWPPRGWGAVRRLRA